MTKKKRTNYDRGRETEYKIIHELTEKGFINAGRTAGSHGMFDIVAVKPGEHVVFIQAKRSKEVITFERLYKEDLDKILDALPHMPEQVQCEAWVWVDRKGWHQKIVIKEAGQTYTNHDIKKIRSQLAKGINIFREVK